MIDYLQKSMSLHCKEIKRKTIEQTHMGFEFHLTLKFTVEDLAQREALHHIKDFIFH
jgi:hypothetical protein